MSQSIIYTVGQFIHSIGVDTHLSYTDGGYANVSNVIADLKYLGINNVRDSLVNPSHLATYEQVAAQGFKFTLTVAGQTQTSATLASDLGLAQALMKATPGSVQAIEGANEINNWPITFNGVGGISGALALQSALYTAVHGTPAFNGVAVDYFTGYGAGGVPLGPNPATTAGLADYDTQHPYPTQGRAPGAQIDTASALNNEPGAHGPAVYTETGYSSNGGLSGAVNSDVQAKYDLDLLFDAFKDGVTQTYLYDLLDAYAPGSKQGDDGYGLFNPNNSAKPVAVALHDLTSILSGNASNANLTTGSLDPTFSGLPSTGADLILQKSNGAYDIVVWAEPQIWNAAKGVEVGAPTETVTVNLGHLFQNVSIFDPMVSASPTTTLHNAQIVQIK